jgi:hypothetical protein
MNLVDRVHIGGGVSRHPVGIEDIMEGRHLVGTVHSTGGHVVSTVHIVVGEDSVGTIEHLVLGM